MIIVVYLIKTYWGVLLYPIRMTPTSISGVSPVASGGVDSPSEGSMVSFSLPSSLSLRMKKSFGVKHFQLGFRRKTVFILETIRLH
jgi:hypothetical protein